MFIQYFSKFIARLCGFIDCGVSESSSAFCKQTNILSKLIKNKYRNKTVNVLKILLLIDNYNK